MIVIGSVMAGASPHGVRLSDDMFQDPVNRIVWSKILELSGAGEPCDFHALSGIVGNHQHLIDCFSSAVPNELLPRHIESIRNQALLRRISFAGVKISKAAETESDPLAALGIAKSAILEIEESAGGGPDGPRRVGDHIDDAIDRIAAKARGETISYIPTGIESLDTVYGGIGCSRLTVVAARPGIGKTSLIRSMAMHAACIKNIPTLIFSLEMTHEELTEQFMAVASNFPAERLDRGDVDLEAIQHVKRGSESLRSAPLFVDDRILGAQEIVSEAISWRARVKSDTVLVAVDYLGLLRSIGQTENRTQEVGRQAWAMKTLAKALRSPVLLVSQLNRRSEYENRDPQISDLRESGEIEQHAHTIIFPTRDITCSSSGPASLIVAKNRGGKTGRADCYWDAPRMIFASDASGGGEDF